MSEDAWWLAMELAEASGPSPDEMAQWAEEEAYVEWLTTIEAYIDWHDQAIA